MKILRSSLVVLFMLVMIGESYAQTCEKDKVTHEEVMQLMKTFRDGYIKRDTSIINDFMTNFTDDIVYMGVASHEFFKGLKRVRRLTLWDWKKWFDLRLPLDKLDVRIDNNVAWFAIRGTSGPWRNKKIYEIRLFGSMIKHNGKLLFKQICFSYPAPLREIK